METRIIAADGEHLAPTWLICAGQCRSRIAPVSPPLGYSSNEVNPSSRVVDFQNSHPLGEL